MAYNGRTQAPQGHDTLDRQFHQSLQRPTHADRAHDAARAAPRAPHEHW